MSSFWEDPWANTYGQAYGNRVTSPGGGTNEYRDVQYRTNPNQFDSPNAQLTPHPLDYGQGESTQDAITRLLRDRLGGATARYNRLGTQTGATSQMLANVLNPLNETAGMVDAEMNSLSGLTGQLISSSLGSTAGAGMAAANAARLSGDGRYGGGGMAAILAGRGATDAAVGQSSALSQAIVQGRLGEAQHRSGLLAQRGGIASTISQILQQQAGLMEDRGKLGVAMETEQAQILGGALGVYGGIQTGRDQKPDRPSIFGLF